MVVNQKRMLGYLEDSLKKLKEGFKKIELIKDLKDINRFIIGYG